MGIAPKAAASRSRRHPFLSLPRGFLGRLKCSPSDCKTPGGAGLSLPRLSSAVIGGEGLGGQEGGGRTILFYPTIDLMMIFVQLTLSKWGRMKSYPIMLILLAEEIPNALTPGVVWLVMCRK